MTCHLRRMVESDITQVLLWRNQAEVRQYMYTQHEISLKEHRAWFERVSKDRGYHVLIVEEAAEPLGFVQFKETVSGVVADWGFYTVPGSPKGAGRKLAHAALTFAFDTLGFHKVCGQVLNFNDRSIAFHKALGFLTEGVLREQYFDGENYHSILYFGLLSREWRPNIENQ